MLAPLHHNNPPSEMEIVAGRLQEQEKEIRSRMKFMAVPLEIADEEQAGQVTDTLKGIANIGKKVADVHKSVKEPYLECGRTVDTWKKRIEVELEGIKAKYAAPLNKFLEKRATEERQRQIEAARAERERAERLAAEATAHEQAGIGDTAQELMDQAVYTEVMANRMEETVHTATPSQLAKSRSHYGATASQKLVWSGEIENLSAIDLNHLRVYFSLDAIQTAINKFVSDGGRNLDGVKIEQKTRLSVR